MRIMYILGTFPKISSEACILNEMVEIKKMGHELIVLAADRDDGIYHNDILDHDIIGDTIHFRNYGIVNWRMFKRSPGERTELLKKWTIGGMKTLDFLMKISYDLFSHPRETIASIRALIRTHSSIFSVSDTYLGYRKIGKRPDLIHVQFPHLNHLNQVDYLSNRFDCPFTVTFRALDLYEEGSRKHERIKMGIVGKARKVITISKFNKTTVKRRFGRDAVVVHSAINTEKFRPDNARKKMSGPFTIIFVGRFVEKKGIKHLIEACGILKEQGNDFRLRLVGDGPLRNDYRRMIRKCGIGDNTVIKGPVPQEDIIEELKRSDVFVLPSVMVKNGDRDILPNSLKEAMAMKVPVITTDISGIRELIEDGRTGLLIGTESAMGIVEAVQKVISDPEMMNGIVEEGRKKIERDFNIEVEAKKLNAVFHEAVEST